MQAIIQTFQAIVLFLVIGACSSSPDDLILDYDFASDLASLPLECYHKEFPYKDSITLESEQDLSL